ncbi:MAG TPA: putative nucleotidyltransferase substrate binding domain-containing protein, partial [Candidatus Bathyarchaeia archaeon]|nr:putative nucleotidyltransferase substrate binding domain-containing protein [Candidatus Bathyarchaeia archaeon]
IGHPELLDTLVRADLALTTKGRVELERDLAALFRQAENLEERLDVLRRFRNDEFLRIGVHDIAGELHYSEVSAQLTALAEVSLTGAYEVALEERRARYGAARGLELAVIAMGKLGGGELNYHSDLDLIFVYGPGTTPLGELVPADTDSGEGRSEEPASTPQEPRAESDGTSGGAAGGLAPQEFFSKVAQLMMLVLQLSTREGYVYKIDTRLRPSGRSGPLVASLDGFARYHARSSAVWERQALVRARVVAGPEGLRRAVDGVIERFVYGRGLEPHELAEIAHLRERMERELAREDERHFNLKTGRGGLVDIEFIAQALALEHGHAEPSLRERSTRRLLDALGACGLLGASDHATLTQAYSFLRGLENRLRIEGDQPIERVPRDPSALASAARRMGYREAAPAAAERMLGDYERHREAVREVYRRVVGRHGEA